MRYIVIAGLFLIQLAAFSQDGNRPAEVTVEVQNRIRREISKEILNFKEDLEKGGYNEAYQEFATDTFRIERFMSKWIELDISDFEMKDAIYKGAELYDSLLNKYYKKLLSVLKADDKKVLIQTQKAWLNFRDNEIKLVNMLSKPEYSGGGTIQQLTNASFYFDIIKHRANALFEHLARTIQEE